MGNVRGSDARVRKGEEEVAYWRKGRAGSRACAFRTTFAGRSLVDSPTEVYLWFLLGKHSNCHGIGGQKYHRVGRRRSVIWYCEERRAGVTSAGNRETEGGSRVVVPGWDE